MPSSRSLIWRGSSLVITGAVFTIGIASLHAHRQVPAAQTFDVVSIKPVPPGRIPMQVSGTCLFRANVFRCPASTAQHLISMAFGVDNVRFRISQIVGGPEWLKTSQFELTAPLTLEVDQATFSMQLPPLLRGVLEDRFALRTHMETRPLPVYALTMAGPDKRLGPRMHRAVADCPAPPANLPQVSPPRRAITSNERSCFGGIYREGQVVAPNVTMQRLADLFSNFNFNWVDRMVVDRTGLIGTFDVDLEWAPANASPSDPRPSLFTAVQEQLGLRLVPRNEEIEVLVVDRIEMPTPN